jgi:predicted dehydrogenase
MIQVGIVGPLTAISRHTNALGKIKDIRITGRWIAGGDHEPVTDADTGKVFTSTSQVLGNADVLIIAGGGDFCNNLAVAALRSARHVFLHAAVVRSVNEANQLMKLAREANVILRSARTGRANAMGLLQALQDKTEISMIELQHYYRITGNKPPIGMAEALLADLEVISSLVKARIISIKAKGLCMLSSQPDIVNARLEYDNGCAVNYNCNLVAPRNEFLGTVVLKNRILKHDFLTGEITTWLLQPVIGLKDPVFIESARVENADALTRELTDFITQIVSGPACLPANDNGFEPFVLADRILEKVMKTLVRCS